jgi:hypothetical protein
MWFDKCQEREDSDISDNNACDYYDSGDDVADTLEYEADVAEREGYYDELVAEQRY